MIIFFMLVSICLKDCFVWGLMIILFCINFMVLLMMVNVKGLFLVWFGDLFILLVWFFLSMCFLEDFWFCWIGRLCLVGEGGLDIWLYCIFWLIFSVLDIMYLFFGWNFLIFWISFLFLSLKMYMMFWGVFILLFRWFIRLFREGNIFLLMDKMIFLCRVFWFLKNFILMVLLCCLWFRRLGG